MSEISHTQACRRLRACGLSKSDTHAILNTVGNWVKNNGEEWTVTRLKAIKVQFLQTRSGNSGFRQPYLKVDGLGRVKGPFLPLFKLGGTFKNEALGKVLQALMIYTSFVSSKPTDTQKKKFFESVTTQNTWAFEMQISQPMVQRVKELVLCSPRIRPASITGFPQSGTSTVPIRNGESTVPLSSWEEWLPDNLLSGACLKYLRKLGPVGQDYSPFSQIKEEVFGGTPFQGAISNFGLGNKVEPEFLCQHTNIGRISVIQEPGFKGRFIANPNRVIQIALSPLQKVLDTILKGIPGDATHDQGAPSPIIARWLSEGHEVSSVDLSDATNNFPLDVTMKALSIVGRDCLRDGPEQARFRQLVETFKSVSREEWFVPRSLSPTGEATTVRWTKGQPLGLICSFSAFALSHHFVIDSIMTDEEANQHHSVGPVYFILGDDIVIRDKSLADRYRLALQRLGCPVSSSKTLTSDSLAEFAGKIITPQGSVSAFKWRSPSDRSFLDVARNLGPSSISLFPKRQRKVLKAIGSLPEELGGLGWNPKGLSIEARIEAAWPLVRVLLDQVLEKETALIKAGDRIRTWLELTFVGSFPAQIATASAALPDQGRNVKKLDSQLIADVFQFRSLVGLLTSYEDMGYQPGTLSTDPRGISMLEKWERLLASVEPTQPATVVGAKKGEHTR